MVKILLFVLFVAIFSVSGYCLYFSGWKRGMAHGEEVVKRRFKKKFTKWEEKLQIIREKQVELEEIYNKHGEKIRELEIKAKLRPKSVVDIGAYHSNLKNKSGQSNIAIGSLQGETYRTQTENQMRAAFGAQQSSPLYGLLDGLFSSLKPPWM